jgi:hypothetical protein
MTRPKRYPWSREMYAYWFLRREGEYIGDGQEQELTEEEERKLDRSKAWHPSQGHTMEA